MLGYKHILKSYAAQTGVDYKGLLQDFESETDENKADFLYQIGGRLQSFPTMSGNRPVALVNTPNGVKAVQMIDNRTISMDDMFSKDSVKVQGNKAYRIPAKLKKQQGGEVMQIVQMFAQATGQDPAKIMQQLQQLPPKEQQAAIQQMVQQLQQSDEPEAVDNPQEEQAEMQQGGYDLESLMGYRDDSPFKFRPSNTINSNSIDMSNTGTALYGLSDEGDLRYLEPYSGLHKFKGNKVTEFPAQVGIGNTIDSLKKKYADMMGVDVSKLPKNLDIKSLYNLALINKNKLNNSDFINTLEQEAYPYLKSYPKSLNYQEIFTKPANNIPVTQAQNPKDRKSISIGAKTSKGYDPKINSDSWNKAWRDSGLIPSKVWDGLTNKQKQDFVFDFADKDNSRTIDAKEVPNFGDKYNSRNKFVDGIIGKRTVQILPPKLSPGMFLPSIEQTIADSDQMVPPSEEKKVYEMTDAQRAKVAELDMNSVTSDNLSSPKEVSVNKPLKKFNLKLNNPLASLANNVALTKAFSPAALPFLQQSRIKSAEIPLIDERGYIQQINNVFNPIKANINANSTTGQAYLANLAGQEAKQVNETLNEIAGKNQQIMAQNNANRVQAMNQEFAGNEAARANYYDQYLQNTAARDAGIQSTLNQIAQQKERDIAMQNSLNATLYNTPFLEDTTSDLDRLLGNRSIGLDPIKFQQILVDRANKDTETFILNGKTYKVVNGEAKEVKAQTGLSKFMKKKLG